MSESVSVVVGQIERVVYNSGRQTRIADFKLSDGFLCCSAWIDRETGVPWISHQLVMRCDQAAMVAVALQMAIDWLMEEMTK